MNKKLRQQVFEKFGGLCAYSGTPLDEDWQVDHKEPIIRNWWTNTSMRPELDNIKNMYPCQKIINHYKGNLSLEIFRNWYLRNLHERLKKLPKNPKVKKSIKRKEYLLKVASYFGINEETPFNGVFYFETLDNEN